MTAYNISAEGVPSLRVEDDDLTLTLDTAWASLADAHGTVLAIPTARVRSIMRDDQTTDTTTDPAR